MICQVIEMNYGCYHFMSMVGKTNHIDEDFLVIEKIEKFWFVNSSITFFVTFA